MSEKKNDISKNNNNYALFPGKSKQILTKVHQKVKYSSEEDLSGVDNKKHPETELDYVTEKRIEVFNDSNLADNEQSNFNLDWVHHTISNKNRVNPRELRQSNHLHYFSKSDHIKSNLKMQQASEADLYSYSKDSTLDVEFNSKIQEPNTSDTLNLNFGEDYTIESPAGDFLDGQNLDGQLVGDRSSRTNRRMSDDYNHLDEPILDTLFRDLLGIYSKMKIIALPMSSYDIYKIVLRGWDLWGPLLLCTFLAFSLHHSEDKDNHLGPHFADVFVLVWFGSCVVSLNYRLLSISSLKNQSVSSQLNRLNTSNQTSIQQSEQNTTLDTNREMLDNVQQSTSIAIGPQDSPYQTLLSPPSMFQLMCVFGYCLVAPCFGVLLLKIFSLSSLFFERIVVGLIFGFAWPTFCSVRILIRYQHPNKRALAIYPIGLFYFVLSCMIILNH